MATIEETLLKMKQQVESSKQQLAQAEGALKQLMQQLKDEHGITDLAAGEAQLDAYGAEEKELAQQIAQQVEKLRADYPWQGVL